MPQRCALCGQTLPEGMDAAEMHRRLDKLSAEVAERETNKIRTKLARDFRDRLAEQTESVRKKAAKEAQESSRQEIRALQRSLEAAQRESQRVAERAAREAVKENAKRSQREIDLLKQRTVKERAQHAADTGRLKAKVDELQLKLERQTSEQMGEMAEADAFAALRGAFPHDDIQRIGRGVRGCDIVHKVMVEGIEAGRIVYECKNVSTWQNDWLTKAKSYRSEYQTQWVVIASRCFPRREKWFVVERGVPVIDLRLIVKLAEVIRGAVIEISQLRTSNVGRRAKAEQMFEYVRSDHFVGRFKAVAEAIASLRDHQTKERTWHTDAWAKQSRLFDDLETNRGEISARIRAIAEDNSGTSLRLVGGER